MNVSFMRWLCLSYQLWKIICTIIELVFLIHVLLSAKILVQQQHTTKLYYTKLCIHHPCLVYFKTLNYSSLLLRGTTSAKYLRIAHRSTFLTFYNVFSWSPSLFQIHFNLKDWAYVKSNSILFNCWWIIQI